MAEMNDRAVISIPKIGPFDFSITNTVLYMWFGALVVFLFFFIAAKRMKKSPEGLQTTAEILLNFATGHLTGPDRREGQEVLLPHPHAVQLHHGHQPHRPHPEAVAAHAHHARPPTST